MLAYTAQSAAQPIGCAVPAKSFERPMRALAARLYGVTSRRASSNAQGGALRGIMYHLPTLRINGTTTLIRHEPRPSRSFRTHGSMGHVLGRIRTGKIASILSSESRGTS